MQWNAIILAGQRPGIDPLAAHFGQDYKALVPIDRVPMLKHVLKTLSENSQIGRIIVLGQEPEILKNAINLAEKAEFMQSGDGISTSLKNLIQAGGVALPWLVTTADHPLLTNQMIDEFLGNARTDISIGMVEKQNMMSTFPEAKRTWLRFSDGHWSGTNLFAFRNEKVSAALSLWAKAEQDRKQVWKIFLRFGPILALRAITRTIGLHSAIQKAGNRLGLTAEIIALSDPIAAIDVDKPADHALASQIIAKRKGL